MKTKLTKLVAMMMILSMMILNFAPVLSYAIEVTNLNLQGKDTNIKNVKFDVFFADGNHEIKKEMMGEDETIIKVMVKVEDEGYIENSQVDFSKANFNVELLEEDEFVESMENNILKLNKLNKGEEKVVSLRVKEKALEEMQADSLYKVSSVSLSGKYINGEGKEEAIVSNKDVKLSWTSVAEANLEVEISKYLPVVTSSGSMLMLQEKVKSNLVDGKLPIKSTHIELNIPRIANELPDEIRVTGETGATNGDTSGSNFGIENYSYDLDKELLTIDVENKADEKGNITWKKDGVDEYLITYIYSEEVLNAAKDSDINIKVEANGKIKAADEDNSSISKELKSEANLSGNIGNIVDAKASINGKVSKGYMLTNTKALEENRKETEYKVSYEVEIGYSALIDGLNIEVTKDKFGVSERELEVANSTYIKELIVNKEDLLKVIGENGLLNIINGEEIVYSIGTDTEVAESGYIVLDLSSLGLDHVSIVSDNIEEEGKLRFDIIKAVRQSIEVSENDVKEMDSIVAGLTVTANNEDEKIAEVEIEGKGELEGTTSKASISLNRDSLSTLQTNEGVKISALLETNSNDDSLYTNPVVEVRLPESFEKVENIEANLFFDDELSIANGEVVDNEDGTKSIKVNLSGVQTKYNLVSTGTLLEIKSDITLDALTPSKQETIKMFLLNENDGTTTETDTTVDTVSLPGLSLSVSSKDADGNQVISSIDDKMIGGLKVSQGKKELEVTTTILNNSDIDYENYIILGRFLSEGNTNIETGVELGSNIATTVKATKIDTKVKNATGDESQFTKYYSKNANATKDLDNAENGWSTERSDDDKSYMIVGNGNAKLTVGMSIIYKYNVEIPANLEYNSSVYGQYALYSSNGETAYSNVYGYSTGSGPEIKAQITSSINSDTVIDSNKIVKYTLEVRNTGMQDAENAEAYVVVPNGMKLLEKNGDNYEDSSNLMIYNLTVSEEEREDDVSYGVNGDLNYFLPVTVTKLELGEIKQGESVTREIFMKNTSTSTDNNIETYAIIQAGDLQVKSNVINNRIEAKLFESSTNSLLGFDSFEVNEVGDIILTVNATGVAETRENVELIINLPNELEYENYEIISLGSNMGKVTFTKSGKTLKYNIEKVTDRGVELTLNVKGNNFSDGYSKNVNLSATIKCDGMNGTETVPIPTITIGKSSVDFVQTSTIPSNSNINEGEDFSYIYTITKKANTQVGNIRFKANLPEEITFIRAEYKYENGDSIESIRTDEKGNPIIDFELSKHNSIVITIFVRVGNVSEDRTAVCDATLISNKLGAMTSNKITHYIKNTGANKTDSDNTIDDNSSNYKPGNNNGGSNTENTRRISGVVWKDENTNGQRDTNERKIQGVRVILMDTNTGKIATDVNGNSMIINTDSNGTYSFSNLRNGNYSVVFIYDTGIYSATEYQKQGVDASANSDGIDTTIQYQGKRQVAAVINSINLQNENIFNMDLGLMSKEKFDLKLEKTVSSISVTTKDGTSTYKYGTNFAKVDVAAKDQNNATLAITYKLKVTNEGHIAGRVDSIVDKLPKELEFSSSLNSDWYSGNDRNIYNDSVTNTILQPGDSIEVSLVLTKRMNSNGYGLINNSAEINKSSNDLGKSDIDSSPGNNAATEDDYSNADVLISVKTGQLRNYAILFVMSAIVLFVGTYTIKRNVMKGDEING